MLCSDMRGKLEPRGPDSKCGNPAGMGWQDGPTIECGASGMSGLRSPKALDRRKPQCRPGDRRRRGAARGESLDRDMSPGYRELMKPSQALALHRERIRAIVAHHGGVNPRVFGSVARGEDTEDSDLYILVDDPEGRRLNLFALGGMNYDISSLIGRPVDVVPSADLPQRMRNETNSEAVPL